MPSDVAITGTGWMGSEMPAAPPRAPEGLRIPAVVRLPADADLEGPSGPDLARRMSRGSLMAVAASAAAWREADGAGRLCGKAVAVVVATTHPVSGFIEGFHDSCLVRSDGAASPSLFAAGVHNAPAFAIMQVLGVSGAACTLVGDALAGVEAVAVARGLLDQRGYACAIVAAASEATEAVANGYASVGGLGGCLLNRASRVRARDGASLGEGGAALVLEPLREVACRGAPARALLRDVASASGASWSEAAARVRGRLGSARVALVPAPVGSRDRLESRLGRRWLDGDADACVVAETPHPEAFAVSFVRRLIAAVAFVRIGAQGRSVVVPALGQGPRYGAVMLGPPPGVGGA